MSKTPRPYLSDYWIKMGKCYAALDARIPERRLAEDQIEKLRCRVCNRKAFMVFDHYALTRPDPWMLFACDCRGKYVWVYSETLAEIG